MLKLTALVVMIAALVVVAPAQGHWQPGKHNALHAITWGFCGHQYKECAAGEEAKGVSGCETGGKYNFRAVGGFGGIYWGLFQQGSFSRGFGKWGWNPWAQADSAYQAWKANGFCWTCNQQWPVCGQGYDV